MHLVGVQEGVLLLRRPEGQLALAAPLLVQAAVCAALALLPRTARPLALLPAQSTRCIETWWIWQQAL